MSNPSPQYSPRPEWAARHAEKRRMIVRMHQTMTVHTIAQALGLTRQRVYQVLKREGVK